MQNVIKGFIMLTFLLPPNKDPTKIQHLTIIIRMIRKKRMKEVRLQWPLFFRKMNGMTKVRQEGDPFDKRRIQGVYPVSPEVLPKSSPPAGQGDRQPVV